MANYFLHADIISRGGGRKKKGKKSKGRSVVACAAYICKYRLHDSYNGKDYDRRYYDGSVPLAGVRLPAGAPLEFENPQFLLDALNAAERRKDSQMARSFIMSLPLELKRAQQIRLVEDFVRRNFTSKGFPVILGLHENEANTHGRENLPAVNGIAPNPHVHCLCILRTISSEGFAPNKSESRETNRPDYLISLRADWAKTQNRCFERIGIPVRVSHESLRKQGVLRKPVVRLDPKVFALERKGIQTARGDEYREIVASNRRLEYCQRTLARETSRDFAPER